MTTKNSEGTTPPAAVPAPAATEQQQPAAKPAVEAPRPIVDGDVLEHEANEETPPSIPSAQPPAGTEYVFDPEDGLWHVRRVRSDEEIAAAIAKAQAARGDDDEETPAKGDEAAGKAVAEAVQVPTILPDSIQYDEASTATVRELAQILGEAGYSAPQAQRLVDLGAEFFVETNEGHPHLDDREAVEATLRNRWGSAHDESLAAVHAASKKLGKKFIAWLETGPGNNVAVIEALRALGSGDLSLGKEAAQKEMQRIRESAPMKDRFHRDHKFVVNRYRTLAHVVARGDDNGAGFEQQVSRMLTAQIKGGVNAGKVDPLIVDEKIVGKARPAAAGEGHIAQIRSKLATVKYGSDEWRSLRVQLNQAYAAAYPGDHQE